MEMNHRRNDLGAAKEEGIVAAIWRHEHDFGNWNADETLSLSPNR